MSAQRERFERQAKEIKCLLCSSPRIVLDGFTNRMIKDGAYTGTVVERRKDPRRRPQTS